MGCTGFSILFLLVLSFLFIMAIGVHRLLYFALIYYCKLLREFHYFYPCCHNSNAVMWLNLNPSGVRQDKISDKTTLGTERCGVRVLSL